MPSTSAKQAKFMKAVANNPKFAKKVGVPQSVGKDFEMADKKKGRKFGSGGAAKKPMMESDRKPIDMRRAILGSDKDIVARGNRTPYEPIPKKGPEKPKQKLGRMGEKGYAKGGKVKKYALGGTPTPAATPAVRPAATPAVRPAAPAPTTSRPGVDMAAEKAKGDMIRSALGQKMAQQVQKGVPGAVEASRSMGYKTARPGVDMAAEKAKGDMIRSALSQKLAAAKSNALKSNTSPQVDARYAKGGKVMKKSDKAGRALVKKSADTMGRAMMKKAGGGKCYAKGGSVSSRADGCAKKGKTHTKMVAMRKGGSC